MGKYFSVIRSALSKSFCCKEKKDVKESRPFYIIHFLVEIEL